MSGKAEEGENSEKKNMLDVEMKPGEPATTNGKKEPEPQPKMNKKDKYRAKLKRIAMGCTVKGLSRSFASKRYKFKLLWGILFIIGVIMFCYNIHKVAKRYREEPILTQFDRREIPFEWPHITLCSPTNPIPFWGVNAELKDKWTAVNKKFNDSYVKGIPRYNKRKLWAHYIAMSSINPQTYFSNGLKSVIQSVHLYHQQSAMASSSSDFDQFSSLPNFAEAFITILDSIRFPMACYHITPEKLAKLSGNKNPLVTIKLYIIMDFASYKFFNIGYESRKLYMYIHNANSTVDKSSPYYIFPGTDSLIKLGQVSRKRIKDCTKKQYTVELYDIDLTYTRRFNGGYEDCRLHHSQSLFFKKCGCYNPFLPLYKFDDKFPRVCTNMSQFDNTTLFRNIDCLSKVLEESKSDLNFEKGLNKTCGEFRMKKCKDTTYVSSRDTNQWQVEMNDARKDSMLENLGKLMPNAPKKNISTDFARLNLAILKISWDRQPPESTFETYEYSPSQLTSDIGGIAGLWLGLSLISVFELVEVLYFLLKYTMAR